MSAAPTPRSRLATAFCAALALCAGLIAGAPVTTNDLFWHVATGAHLLDVRTFPTTDVLSYTAGGQTWFLHEWLTQVIFHGIHEVGGLPLLRIFTGLFAAALHLQFWRFARQQLRSALAASLCLLVFSILVLCRLQTRPTLFSIAFFLGLASWFARTRGPWRLRDGCLLVAVVLVWANLHSVGLLGPVLYGSFALGSVLRRLRDAEPVLPTVRAHGLTLLGAVAACCCTPSGLHIWGFAFQDKSHVMNFIVDEWGAFQPWFDPSGPLPLLSYVTILTCLGLITAVYLLTGIALNPETRRLRSAAMPDPVHLLILLLCVGGGLMAIRFHWFLSIGLVLAIRHGMALCENSFLLRFFRFPALRPTALLVIASGALLAGTLLHYGENLRYRDLPLHRAVLAAEYRRAVSPDLDLPGIQFLKTAGIAGNAFCHYGSGGMLSYHLFPRVKVFIDSRADLYRRQLLLEFLAVRDGHPDQQRILDQHGTDIYYRHWEIAPLNEPQHWARIYTGPDGEIWLRKKPENHANLARAKAWHAAPRGP